MHYSSPDVRKLSIIDEKGRPIEYGINYNPNDISTIAIFKDGLWVADGRANELKLADGTYQHLSLWERKILKNWLMTITIIHGTGYNFWAGWRSIDQGE